jgi:hypothetical protein
LGIGPRDLWPFGSKKTEEQKAAENLALVNESVQNFKHAHEVAVRLYRQGKLPEKLRKKHVELRDKINNQLLIKIMNSVSPQEYLEIHNYLANVRKDVGLEIAPLLLAIGGIIALSALTGAAALAKESFNHAKELDLVESGQITGEQYAEIQKERDKGGGDSWIQKLFGIDLMPIAVGGVLIFFGPQILSMIQSRRKKS